jgi:hypothetical protein
MPVMVFTPGGHIIAPVRCQGVATHQQKKGKQNHCKKNGDITKGIVSMMAHGDLPFSQPGTATSG